MKVSVVLVTHNRGKLLNFVLYSLLRQTRLPDEIIVIDDYSSEDVAKIIAEHVKLSKRLGIRVRMLRSAQELGLGASRSLGALISDGDVVVFLDDDSIAQANLIEAYVSILKKDATL